MTIHSHIERIFISTTFKTHSIFRNTYNLYLNTITFYLYFHVSSLSCLNNEQVYQTQLYSCGPIDMTVTLLLNLILLAQSHYEIVIWLSSYNLCNVHVRQNVVPYDCQVLTYKRVAIICFDNLQHRHPVYTAVQCAIPSHYNRYSYNAPRGKRCCDKYLSIAIHG